MSREQELPKWKYFDPRVDRKLACACCGQVHMNDAFMQKLDRIRERLGVPLHINSGYRCPEHNNRVSSTGEAGPHTTGRAVDIAADSRLRYLVATAALAEGMTRIGIARTFIHIDDLTAADGFPDQVIWPY